MRNFKSLCMMSLVAVFVTQAGDRTSSGQAVVTGQDAKRFIGTWRIISENQTGLMIYDGSGNMAAQVMPLRARPKYAAAEPTPDEAKAAITGYIAYFGTYSVDERAHKITHHRKGSINPGQIGVDAVRGYDFASDDRVVLTPAENNARIIWERVR